MAGKVVLISGTAGSQGRIAARIFAEEGAAVVGADIDAIGNRRVVEELAATGRTMTDVSPADLSDPAQGARWVDNAVQLHGRVDVLYNNAGNARFAPFASTTHEDLRFTLSHELDVRWNCCQAVWPAMVAQSGGVIVNVASVSGLLGTRDLPAAAHAASNGAIISLTRQLAAEGAAHGIRVNAVSPGVIATEATEAMLGLPDSPLKSLVTPTMSGAAGAPEAPVHAALFLASDEARYITGQNLVVDGGATVLV